MAVCSSILVLLLVSIAAVCSAAYSSINAVAYTPRIIPGNGTGCPTEDQNERAQEDVKDEVLAILNNTVLPGMFSQCNLGECQENPAISCSKIAQENPTASSRHYWVRTPTTGSSTEVYCEMNTTHCGNSTGPWMRIAFLNMTNPTYQCPEGFALIPEPRRSCGKEDGGCTSAFFASFNIPYSKVCGRVIGYQVGEPDAFKPYFYGRYRTINNVYVDGISITHGLTPRRHIWTFAAAEDEIHSSYTVCPCTRTDLAFTGLVPPFIGNDYFCDTGSRNAVDEDNFYKDDPLWDGEGCGRTSSCCSWNNPPWFYKNLPDAVVDDIEVRLCSDSGGYNENTPIELLEIYTQ